MSHKLNKAQRKGLLINPFMPSRFYYRNSWDWSFSLEGVPSWFLLSPCFIEIPVFIANSEDSDQMLCSAASNLGLHCLPMSLLWDTRHKWVKFVGELLAFTDQ